MNISVFVIVILLFCSGKVFSQDMLSQIMLQISETTDSEKKVSLLLEATDLYFYENSDSAFLYSLQANDIVNTTNFKNDSLKAESELSLGSLYGIIQDTSKAFKHLDNAIRIAKEQQMTSILADCYGNKGLNYGYVSVYDQAMINHEKSRNLHTELNDLLGISIANNNIGIMYLDLKAYDKAISYFEENYKIDLQLGDMHDKAITLFNLGLAMKGKKNYDEALAYFLSCKAIADSLGFKYSLMRISGSLGELYDKKNMQKLSFEYSQRSYSLAIEFGQKPDIAMSAIYIAKFLNKQKKYNEALEMGNEALNYINDISSREIKATIYKTVADSYYGLNEF